jgi:hypothetical protein
MHINAMQIENWARTKSAQSELPRVVRRLIHATASVTGAAFPAGDATSTPGWDGQLDAKCSTPWIPKGKSFWELSCAKQVTNKANKDYEKRTQQTPKKTRASATLVIVTARRWGSKAKWLEEKRHGKQWKDIRAYDANDLEQWLEQAPAVALQFAEELGLHGPGVESVAKYWKDWSQQSKPAITAEALFIDRQDTRDRLLTELSSRLNSGQAEPYTIKADSVEEATAFVCAALLTEPALSAKSLVVTQPNGWIYVEQNPTLNIALAARPEFAEKPSRRKRLVTIIPYATGAMGTYYRGVAGREGDAELTIARPKIDEFKKALCSIGFDEAESERLAVSTGRSWSVYRRRCATNPAVRKPAWLDLPQASVLSTVCLLGGWSADKPADREVVAQVSRQSYEEVERALRHLAQVDDPPVLQIGEVWKAKSPLELLDLFGDRITSDELDRFFKIAKSILLMPDPQLDLPDEERHAARIYGKVRPQSDLLIESLCDTLIKLAVRGPGVPALASLNIEGRVAAFVRDLLEHADGTRWLSLASLLPDLAEAAPAEFLKAVDESLATTGAPVTRLLTETDSSSLLGRCWHAGLLWALERLAWAPERLARVSLILARLSRVEIRGNWGNTPLESLVGIFRSWYPRTAADVNQRIAVLDTLTNKEPDAAFDLLDKLVHVHSDSAHPTARPVWRDDDARAGCGATEAERRQMVIAAADRLIASSKGHPKRIARVIEKITVFDQGRVKATLDLADQFTRPGVSDEDREVIRTALRKHIHWHRNYDKVRGKALDKKLKEIEALYERLTPEDLVVRHRWLFRDGRPGLPARVRDAGYGKRGELVETWRTKALRELYLERGLSGIEQLAQACGPQSCFVGLALSKLNVDTAELAEWIAAKGGGFTSGEPLTMAISGLLRASESPGSMQIVNAVLERARERGWDPGRTASFLVLAPEQRSTWEVVADCGTEVEQAYWATTTPSPRLSIEEGDFEFALRRLLAAGRPRTALQVSHYDMKAVEPKLLADMLERFLKGEEADGPLPDSWTLGEAIDALEASGSIENDRLIRLEFGLIPTLGFDGEQHAKSLYSAIVSDPKLFTELVCIIYKPANADRDDDIRSEARQAARIAWRVLRHCRRLPGTQPDGTVDRDSFFKFIEETRERCRQADRLAVCDITLGEILAHAPAGADGVWPCEPVRDVLDRLELGDMRRGFHTGTINKRGVSSRALDEGGRQERGLAEEYRKHARALHHSHVNLAAALEAIARDYENMGRREDVEAQLRREGC